MKIKDILKKFRKLIIAVVIIAVIAVGVVNLIPSKAAMTPMMQAVETGDVERKDLVESISASGTVQSMDSREVFVNLSGIEVKEIHAEVGDYVEEGTLICEFDTEDLEESLANVTASLNASQGKTNISLSDSERSLNEAKTSQQIETERAKEDTNQAYLDLEDAYIEESDALSDYEDAKNTTQGKLAEYNKSTEDAKAASDKMKSEEGKMNSAKAAFTTFVNAGKTEIGWKDADDLDVANIGWQQLSLSDFETEYVDPGANINPTADKISEYYNSMKTQAVNYQSAAAAYSAASADYQSASARATEFQQKYNSALTAESSAKTAYENAGKAIETAQSSLENKQRSEEDTLRNQSSTVASKESSLTSVQLDKSTAGQSEKSQIKTYEEQIALASVYAPFSGVITDIALEEGQTYNGTTIFTIEDDSAYIVTAQIEEYDISKIALGQRVLIKVEGAGNEELDGTVTYISPRAASNASAVKYDIEISIDTPNENLRMDMTAKISIIIKEVSDVLTIPYNGLQEDEDGNYFVEVVEQDGNSDTAADGAGFPSGEADFPADIATGSSAARPGNIGANSEENTTMPSYRKIYVETGAENSYYVEIISDEIKEGMKVRLITSSSESDAFNINMGMGRMGGF